MLKYSYVILSRTLLCSSLLIPLHSGTVCAMDVERDSKSSVACRQPVPLLVNCELKENARDLGYFQRVLDIMGPQMTDFHAVEYIGTGALKTIGVNGFGASLIVHDREFESDASTNYIYPRDFMFDQRTEVAHGTVVAATAASKNPSANAIAFGSTVYPVCSLTPKEKQEKDRLDKEVEETGKRLFDELESNAAKRKELSSRLSPSNQVATLKEIEALFARSLEIIDLLSKSQGEYSKGMTTLSAPLSDSMCDQLEAVVSFSKAKGLEVPRVINMSLGFEVKEDEFQGVLDRLTAILNSHDMLLVNSAGNEGKEILPGNMTAWKGRINVQNVLEKYPDLLKRMLNVCAYEGFDNTASDWSNRAGILKDNTILAYGLTNRLPTLDSDGFPLKDGSKVMGGTSFASPRVAAMAVILHKYFPHLSMLEIKDILLRTAFKPEDHNEAVFGQGGLNPLMAWIEALKTDPTLKEATGVTGLLSKLRGFFTKN